MKNEKNLIYIFDHFFDTEYKTLPKIMLFDDGNLEDNEKILTYRGDLCL
jgi:hypothetical protein